MKFFRKDERRRRSFFSSKNNIILSFDVLIGQLHNFSNSSPHYALKVPPTLQQLRRQFKRFDDNGDGKISRKEFEVMAEQCYYDLLKK